MSWQSTFCAVMAENPPEEIDLLVKWLGPNHVYMHVALEFQMRVTIREH